MPKTQYNFRIDPVDLDKLKSMAKDHNRSVTNLLNTLIKSALEKRGET